MLIIYDDKERKAGVKEYLENGTNNDRNFKDDRIALLGDLDVLNETVEYSLKTQTNWNKEYYRNIVLSFEEDNISEETLRKIAIDFDKNYTIGLNKDEYVAYAEVHYPKIKLKLKDISDPYYHNQYEKNKYNPNFDLNEFIQELDKNNINYTLKKRKPHIHYSIAMYSPKLDVMLNLGHHGATKPNARAKELELLKKYLEAKYNLKSVDKKPISQGLDEIYIKDKYSKQVELKSDIKAHIKAHIKEYNNFDDMIADITKTFNIEAIKHSTAKAKTKYISIKHPSFERNIKLKGDLFYKDTFLQAKQNLINELSNPNQQNYIPQKEQGVVLAYPKPQELIKLQNYRIKILNDRYKNKRTTDEMVKPIFISKQFNTKEFKEKEFKLFYKPPKVYTYKSNSKQLLYNFKKNGLTGLMTGLFKNDIKSFTQNLNNLFNTAIKAYTYYNRAKNKKLELEQKQAELKAKFEANQIKYKELFEAKQAEFKKKFEEKYIKPTSPIDTQIRKIDEKIDIDKVDLKTLKELINANDLLDYLHNKKIIKSDYKVLPGNKIQVGNKRMNVLDFCLKELHLSFAESTTLLKDVYNLDIADVKKEVYYKEKGDKMEEVKIDWGDIKKTINPLVLNTLFNANIQPNQIVKGYGANKDEYRIKVNGKHITLTDYLLKELKMEYKDIKTNEFINKLKLANKELLLANINSINIDYSETLKAEQKAKRDREQVEFINHFNLYNLSIFAEVLGYEYKQAKSTKTYQVLKKDDDTIIVYKNKKGHYRFKRPNLSKDSNLKREGGIYELFSDNGIKRYDLIVNKIKSIDKQLFKELQTKYGALQVGGVDDYEKQHEAYNLWESYSNNVDFSYLIDERQLDINTINKYSNNFKQSPRSNIVVAMYRANEGGGFKFVGNSHRNTNGFKLIEGNKGIEILTPNNLNIGEKASVVVCENYIDGLSLVELKGLNNAIILSTAGQATKNSYETISEYIKQNKHIYSIDNVLLAFDNDENGEHYTNELINTFKEFNLNIGNIKIKRVKAKNKDFNDDLKDYKDNFIKNTIKELSHPQILDFYQATGIDLYKDEDISRLSDKNIELILKLAKQNKEQIQKDREKEEYEKNRGLAVNKKSKVSKRNQNRLKNRLKNRKNIDNDIKNIGE